MMAKYFNVTGICIPEKHYMADISATIKEITETLVDQGAYFCINRARQYGKTTTLYLLEKKLRESYIVLSLSFEAADDLFASAYAFAAGLVRRIGKKLKLQGIPAEILNTWNEPLSREFAMEEFSDRITELCDSCKKDIVLMIDEVDKSSDNQIFLSFLGLLRAKYLEQQKGQDHTFKSVILAGVYDIKNLKLKIHPGQETKYNSPWNIAADFDIDMSLTITGIERMLTEYEHDHHTGMDISQTARSIYDYTSGYPYLVSRICKLIDENADASEPDKYSAESRNPGESLPVSCTRLDSAKTECRGWCRAGIAEAVRMILKSTNTLFDDMQKKIMDYPKLKQMIYSILFGGKSFPFYPVSQPVKIGVLFGFIKEEHEQAVIANRIFETFFYDLFLAEDILESQTYDAALQSGNQFVKNGILDMELILTKFLEHYHEIYDNCPEKFTEENGRKLFLLYLKPIINGTGNYYIESRTRSLGRTDVVIDYLGRQTVVELKIWRGNAYQKRGVEQLAGYLEDYQLEKGYLLSFCFNKNKKTGKRVISCGGKMIVEVVV